MKLWLERWPSTYQLGSFYLSVASWTKNNIGEIEVSDSLGDLVTVNGWGRIDLTGAIKFGGEPIDYRFAEEIKAILTAFHLLE